MMEGLRAGPYNGKTTLNCEYMIIHKQGKKTGIICLTRDVTRVAGDLDSIDHTTPPHRPEGPILFLTFSFF